MRPLAFYILFESGIKCAPALFFIIHRRKDILLIQLLCYLICIIALQVQPENGTHYFCGFFVYLQLIFILIRFPVAIRGKGSYKISPLPLDLQVAAYLNADIYASLIKFLNGMIMLSACGSFARLS